MIHFIPYIGGIVLPLVVYFIQEANHGNRKQNRFYATGEDYDAGQAGFDQADRAPVDDPCVAALREAGM